jgi:alkanesulfonate monooxygenase SsuD/methylene tetrahydromethanopterin reductase-like flavin-dependent oxidoreductase (luciferase family)
MRSDQALGMQAAVDAGAAAAGRDPGEIERAVNVMALEGSPQSWADQLARIVSALRFSTFLVGLPRDQPVDLVRRLGEDVAARLRRLL